MIGHRWRPTHPSWALLVPAAPLCLAGLLTLEAIYDPAGTSGLSRAVWRQLAYLALGLACMKGIVLLGYQRLGRHAYALLAGCVLLLVWLLPDMPLVLERNGSRRWIGLGPVVIQPSELTKVAYVLAMAWYLRYRRNYRTLGGLVQPFLITLVPMALIKLQPDLGTVLLFLPVLMAMLLAAGAKVRHLLVVILMGVACLPLLWFKIASYQRLRIVGVVLQDPGIRAALERRPELWQSFRPPGVRPADWIAELTEWEVRSGFQLTHSKTAIGSGGLLGQGWRRGLFVEYDILPERQNDFIFALVAHQWGTWGAVGVLLCYALLTVAGFEIATLTNEPMGRLVAVGAATMLAVQALTNVLMTLGLGPVTGVTLPFVSQGGSSLLTSFALLGLLVSVARIRPITLATPPFEFDEEAERYQHVP